MSKLVNDNFGVRLVPDGEWEPLLFTEMPHIRTTALDGDALVSAYSTAGNVNTFTIVAKQARLTGGTGTGQKAGALFLMPLKDRDGNHMTANQHFHLTFYIRPTNTPDGVPTAGGGHLTDNSDVQLHVGVVMTPEGDDPLAIDNSRLYGGFFYDGTGGPKMQVAARRLAVSTVGGDKQIEYGILDVEFEPSAEKEAVRQMHMTGYDFSGGAEKHRNNMSNSCYFSDSAASPSDRESDPLYIGIFLGRFNAGSDEKTYSFESYYQLMGPYRYLNQETSAPGE